MKRVLLVGWDAADWKIINALMDAGMMPNVKGLIERGVMGNLATLYPMLSPMLWTSIATGKRPFKHGILGFSEPDPRGLGVRPITNISRTTRAVWNILTLLGMKSNVIGWWPSHPAEPILGCMVSDHYHRAVAAHGEPWPMLTGTVHPNRIAKNLADLRVHPQDLDPGLISLFLPKLAEIDQEKDRRVTQMAKCISECTTICNAAEALMHFEPWTLTCVYFDAIDHFSHGFMNYHPPKLDWVNEKDFDHYQEVVRSGYIYHDILLGRLLKETDAETYVMLVSDHGFHSDHLRPRNLPDEPAGPAEQHRHYGILVLAGPGIKQDELINAATLLDVTPTILACLDLPVGEDMDGKVLTDAFVKPCEVEILPSWDQVEGGDGTHAKDVVIDPLDAHEAIHQLVELGYMDSPPANVDEAIEQTVRELQYNLARSYMDASWQIEAVPILEGLSERWPAEFRFGIALINCYLALDRPEDAAALIELVITHKKEDVIRAQQELLEFQTKNRERLEKLQQGDLDALTEEERHSFHRMQMRAGWNPMALSYLRGVIAAGLKDYNDALEYLSRAESLAKDDLRVLLKLGDVYFSLRRWEDAHRMFNRTLEIDPDNAGAWLGLARTLLAMRGPGVNAAAMEAAKRATSLIYYNPLGHFVLGLCYHRARHVMEAIASLQRAIEQNPNFPEAYRRLAYIYEKRLLAPEKAAQYRQEGAEALVRIRQLREERKFSPPSQMPSATPVMPENGPVKFPYAPEDTIVVVSGLPRSGTSMMMQMLAAGGIPALTDGTRAADEDNPRGYYEFEQARTLTKNNAWLSGARGKAVKIIVHMLPALDPKLRYKVIFMWRDMEEVLRSQSTMLKRSGRKGDRAFLSLSNTFTKQLKQTTHWLANMAMVDVCYVDYSSCIEEPVSTAAQINAFLNRTLDEHAMVEAIHPELHRQRNKTT